MTSIMHSTMQTEWEMCFQPFDAMTMPNTYGSFIRGVLLHHKTHNIRSFNRHVYNQFASYITFHTPLLNGYLQTEWMVYEGAVFLCNVSCKVSGVFRLLYQRDVFTCFSMKSDPVWDEIIPWDVWNEPSIQTLYGKTNHLS